MNATPRIDVLAPEQCVDLLRNAEIGRVIFTDHALPAVLPVTFVVDGDDVVLRTARGSRLARAVEGAVVAFEVDDLRPAFRDGWSVVVTGQARLEEDLQELARLDGLLRPWVPGLKDVFIRIPMTVVTGRRVIGHAVPTAVVG